MVTEGEGSVNWGDGEEKVGRGDVLFVSAGKEITWVAGGKLEVFRAFVEAPK